jgi:hypothetical protein
MVGYRVEKEKLKQLVSSCSRDHKLLKFTYVPVMYEINGAMNATVYLGRNHGSWETHITSYENLSKLERLLPFASTHSFYCCHHFTK